MFKFIEGFDEFMELPKVCKVFKRIFQLNGCWVNFVEFNYPKIREIVLKENEGKDVNEIPWQEVLKEGSIKVNSSMDELTKKLTEIKESGNKLYQAKNNFDAVGKYEEGMQLGKTFKELRENPFYNRFAQKQEKVAIFKILTILGANASQSCLNLKNYSKALTFGVKAFKRLKDVKVW